MDTDMVVWQIAAQLTMMGLSAIAGWFGGKIKGAKMEREQKEQESQAEREQNREVNRLLLSYKIQDLFEEYVKKEQDITSAEKHEIEKLYNLYKNLGGNGEGTRMYNELMALKTS